MKAKNSRKNLTLDVGEDANSRFNDAVKELKRYDKRVTKNLIGVALVEWFCRLDLHERAIFVRDCLPDGLEVLINEARKEGRKIVDKAQLPKRQRRPREIRNQTLEAS